MSAKLRNGKKYKANGDGAESEIVDCHKLVDKRKVESIGDEIKQRRVNAGEKIKRYILNEKVKDGNATGNESDKESGKSCADRYKMDYTGSDHR